MAETALTVYVPGMDGTAITPVTGDANGYTFNNVNQDTIITAINSSGAVTVDITFTAQDQGTNKAEITDHVATVAISGTEQIGPFAFGPWNDANNLVHFTLEAAVESNITLWASKGAKYV
jgi:hypothetical protein